MIFTYFELHLSVCAKYASTTREDGKVSSTFCMLRIQK